MSNCKVIVSYYEELEKDGKKEFQLVNKEVQLKDSFNPDSAVTLNDLIQYIDTENEDTVELMKDLSSTVLSDSESTLEFTEDILSQWNDDLISKYGKDVKLIGSDTLDNYVTLIKDNEIYLSILDRIDPNWRKRKVVILNKNTKVVGQKPYIYYKSKHSDEELEILLESYIKSYVLYKLISSEFRKQEDINLINAIDEYIKLNKGEKSKFLDLLKEIKLSSDPIGLFFRYWYFNKNFLNSAKSSFKSIDKFIFNILKTNSIIKVESDAYISEFVEYMKFNRIKIEDCNKLISKINDLENDILLNSIELLITFINTRTVLKGFYYNISFIDEDTVYLLTTKEGEDTKKNYYKHLGFIERTPKFDDSIILPEDYNGDGMFGSEEYRGYSIYSTFVNGQLIYYYHPHQLIMYTTGDTKISAVKSSNNLALIKSAIDTELNNFVFRNSSLEIQLMLNKLNRIEIQQNKDIKFLVGSVYRILDVPIAKISLETVLKLNSTLNQEYKGKLISGITTSDNEIWLYFLKNHPNFFNTLTNTLYWSILFNRVGELVESGLSLDGSNISDYSTQLNLIVEDLKNAKYKFYSVDSTTLLENEREQVARKTRNISKLSTTTVTQNITFVLVNNISTEIPREVINFKPILNQIVEHLRTHFGMQVNIINNDSVNDPKLKDIKDVAFKSKNRAFIYNGLIYLNIDRANASDALHEFAHLILGYIRVKYPKLYDELLSKISDDKVKAEILKNNDIRSLSDIREELLVKEFSTYMLNKLGLSDSRLSTIQKIFKHSVEKVFDLKSNTLTSDLSDITLEDLFGRFGSFMLNSEKDTKINKLLSGESVSTLRKITNALNALLNAKLIVENIEYDIEGNIVGVNYLVLKKVILEEDGTSKEKLLPVGLKYSELELRDIILKHLTAINLKLKELQELNLKAGKHKKKESNVKIDSKESLGTDLELIIGDSKKLSKLKLDLLTDIVFSDEDPETTNIISTLRSFLKHKIDTVASEISDRREIGEIAKDRHYISLYSYLDLAKTLSGQLFIVPFDLDEYLDSEKSRLLAEGLTPEDIKPILDKKVLYFKDAMVNAYNIHKAAKVFFSEKVLKSNIPFEVFYLLVKEDFNNDRDLVSKLFKSLTSAKNNIQSIVGNNVEFIPNILLTSEIVGDSRTLVANVDLIAIDKDDPNREVYVFKFLTSNDLYNTLKAKDYKEQRSDYNLGFIRHMLAEKGIPAENMLLYTVDISVALNDDGYLEDVIFDGVNNRLTPLNVHNSFNRLYWRTGLFFRNISEKIKISLSLSGTSGAYKEDVVKAMHFAFSTVIARLSDSEKEIDDFISAKGTILDSDKPEYRYMFINRTVYPNDPDRCIYIKEDSDKDKNTELRQKVKEYLKKERESHKASYDIFVNSILKVLDKRITLLEALSSFSTATLKFLEVLFRQYLLEDGWKFVKDDALADLGIYLLENQETLLVDIINFSNFSGNLNTAIDLPFGRTILGLFDEDYRAKTKFENILRASKGNIELMKVMFVLNLPEVAAKFNGTYRIGSIKTINMTYGFGTLAGIETLTRSFTELKLVMEKLGFELPNGIEKVLFMDPFTIFKLKVYAMTNVEYAQNLRVDSIYAALERVNPGTLAEMKTELLRIEELMRTNKNWKFLSMPVEEIAKSDNPVSLLYVLLWKCIFYCDGDFLQMEKLNKYSGTFKDRDFLNGTMTNNPGTVPDKNLRRATGLARMAMNRITMRLTDWYSSFRENELAKFHKSKNFTPLQNGILGTQHFLYKNMFRTNSDGTLNSLMMVEDPDDMSNKLRPEEREFLRYFLWEINSVRHKLTSKNDKKIKELKESGEWFWIPLVEADSSSKILLGHITTRLKNSVKELSLKLKSFTETGSETDMFTSDEYDKYNEGICNYQMFNLFSFSESSLEDRLKMLSSVDEPSFWELNLETVLVRYKFAKIRQEEFNRVLPIIKGLRLVGQSYFLESFNVESEREKNSLENFDTFLLNYMNVAIFNKSIINDEARYLSKIASLTKFLAASVALGLNFVGGIRECLEGAWKIIGRSVSGFYLVGDRFTRNDWLKAMGLILIDSPDFVQRVTLLEAICLRFRIANMDINALADRIKSNKAGLANAKDRLLFWFQTSPDYFTRMSLLLAKMIHDGVFEALGYDKNGLTYDWRKDKRFLHYANPNAVHDLLWHQERALYLSLLLLAKEDYLEFSNIKEGDDLPLPYTNLELDAIKDLSDITFGSYDHDVRMMLEKMFTGSLLMLFKTYLSATKTTYFLKPDTYNLGERRLLRDPKTGELLYVDTDENGKPIVTTKVNNLPYTKNVNSFMLGLYWTLEDVYKTFKTRGVSGLKNRLANDRSMLSNLKQFGYNMVVWLILGAIVSYLIKLWAEHRKEESINLDITLSKIMNDELFNIILRAGVGSFTDFNILNSFVGNIMDSEPASISIINNLFTSTGEMLFGDRSLKYWFRTNSGLYRSLSGIGDNLYELYKVSKD